MRLLRLLALRSLRARPLRMALSTFGIVLGVAGILAIGMSNQAALDAVTRLFSDAAGKANLVVAGAGSEDAAIPDSALPRVQALPGVSLAAPVVQVQTVLAEDLPPAEIGLTFFGVASGGLTLHGIDPVLDAQVRDYRISQGRFLSAESDVDEIVLVEPYAGERGVEVGQRVRIRTAGGAAELTVVGLMAKEGPGMTNSGAFGVAPLRTVQTLWERLGELDQIDVVAADGETTSERLENLRLALQEALGSDYSVIYPAARGQRMSQMLAGYQIGLNFLSGMALFVGAFLIYNAFSMTVVERTREFGLMRVVGMSARQVTVQVLAEAAVLGVAGSALGLGVGIVMAQGLAALLGNLMAQDLTRMQVAPALAATSVAVGMIVTVLAAAMPAWQAGRISPLEALRRRAAAQNVWLVRRGWLLGAVLLLVSAAILVWNPFPYDVQFRLGSVTVFLLFLGATLIIPVSVGAWERLLRPVVRVLYGDSGRLGSRNVRRAVLRTTLTVAALMIGVAMTVVVRGMTEPFTQEIKRWMDGYIGGDLYVSSSVGMRSEVWRGLADVEGVAAVAPVRYVTVTWLQADEAKQDLVLMAVDPLAHARVTAFVYAEEYPDRSAPVQRLAAGDAVFVSSVMAEKYGLRVGDTLRLSTRAGSHDFSVAAVVVDFYNQGLVLMASWDDLGRHYDVSDATASLLKVQDGYSVTDVRQRVVDLYGQSEHLVVESNQAIKERVFSMMDAAFVMFDVLALIAVVVAALGIVNTMTMNVMERTQEIGMLRAVGMTRRQIVRMILAEAAVTGVAGGVLGLLFGLVLSRIFLLSMGAMSGYKLTYVVPTTGAALGLIVAVIVANLAAALPARRASQVHVLEAIHYE